MQYIGEIISIVVAVLWTFTAIFSEYGSKRMGTLCLNVIRMTLSVALLSLLLFVTTGSFLPQYANNEVWVWLALSGFVGYTFGDYCLYSSYVLIGSRYGQLLLCLSSVFAALGGFLILDEKLSSYALLGIIITLLGIAMSILAKGEDKHVQLKMSAKGVMFGVGGALGQGLGLVLSKTGIEYYSQNIPATEEAVIQMIPFTGTMIRGIFGWMGFVAVLVISRKFSKLKESICDKKGMTFAVLATMTGPFIGVSFSLMAVQYTATGIAQTLMSLTPIFILVPTYFLFKQKITLLEVLGAVVSIVGVSLFFV